MVRRKQQTAPAGLRLITSEKCEPLVKQLHTIFLLEPTCIRVDRVTFTLNMWRIYMRLLVYTGKTPLYNASVKGDILLHMTVYMWGLRGRYFLTIIIVTICLFVINYHNYYVCFTFRGPKNPTKITCGGSQTSVKNRWFCCSMDDFAHNTNGKWLPFLIVSTVQAIHCLPCS